MKTDWKDALSALKGNMDETTNSSEPEEKEIHEEEKGQISPLTIVTDKKGRNGKIATIIEGFTIKQSEVENIARQIKQKLGVGGSVREGEILIQGDHKQVITKLLQSLNFKTK